MLSSTVVSNALPRIVADLEGSESGYTWVVVATLLTMTATTPLWGKLADLFSKKALVQVVIASIVPPRERGRYFGYLGACFAMATVSGPLIGGVIVDTPWLGWRWTFFVGVRFAVLAFVVLQKTLHLPTVKRQVSIDYLGAVLVAAGVSVLLIWVSLAGSEFAWKSFTTAWMVTLGVVLLLAFVLVETKVEEPIIPLRLFRDRTTSLAVFASVMVGVAMFGATVFLSQYFQIARGMSPTEAGLMSLAMVGGVLVSGIVSGRVISRTGRWKRYIVGGAVLLVAGLALLSLIDDSIPLVEVGAFMAALGTALGHQVGAGVVEGLARLGIAPQGEGHGASIPDMSTLPAPVREVFESAFAEATGHIFWLATPFAALALVAILMIREVPLRTTIERADELEKAAADREPVAEPACA